jgi:hypothetical protein
VSPAKAKAKRRPEGDALMVAAVELLGRTGAEKFTVWYCDEQKPPIAWIAAAQWDGRWQVAAALHPLLATLRLLDEVIDGGQCTHCQRPTGVSADLDAMPLDALVCWYQYDPELKTFRRGCAGDAP